MESEAIPLRTVRSLVSHIPEAQSVLACRSPQSGVRAGRSNQLIHNLFSI
jgi:hypothetical protein